MNESDWDWKRSLPEFSKAVEHGIADGDHFGGQVFVSVRGEVVVDMGFGFSGPDRGHRVDRDMLMLWRSAGKPLTAVALMRLFQDKELSIDMPVGEFIPAFSGDGREAVTVRHLLNHTSGIRPADKLAETLPWDEMVDRICSTPLEPGWDTGNKAGYCIAASWYLLAEICRVLARAEDYSTWIRQSLLVPLGMENTWIGIPGEKWDGGLSERIARVFITSTAEASQHPYLDSRASCCSCRPGGNARGPIRELGHFYQCLLNPADHPGVLPSAGLLDRMTSPARPEGLLDHTFRHIMDWGLGFMVNSSQYGPATVPYGFGQFASASTFGHGGAQCSAGFADPDRDLVVAWAVNGLAGEINHQKRVRRMHDALYRDLFPMISETG
jgi:CubicO group peptidase (beta-lactamase class C family)